MVSVPGMMSHDDVKLFLEFLEPLHGNACGFFSVLLNRQMAPKSTTATLFKQIFVPILNA